MNTFILDQLEQLSDTDFNHLYEHARSCGCFKGLPEFDHTPESILLSQAIVDDEEVAQEAANFIDIGL